MTAPYQLFLLRRTFAAFAAAAALGAVSDAQAQAKVKLNNANGNECVYSSMSITPDGSVNVTCSGTTSTPTTPSVETYVMAATSATAAPNTSAQVTVNRAGPTGTAFSEMYVYYSLSGSGCLYSGGASALFPAGQTSAPIAVQVTGAGTTCTVTLTASTSATAVLGTPAATNITVATATTPAPTPNPTPTVPAGCPAAPADMLSTSFVGIGNPILQMQNSGQIVAIKLLPVVSPYSSASVAFGESNGVAYTPSPVRLEATISKCPGVIDTSNRYCSIDSTNGTYNSLAFFQKEYGSGTIKDVATATTYRTCWAGDPGDYYINARWTYSPGTCSFGAQICGFAIQQNIGAY